MSSKSMNIDINEWQIEEIKKGIAEADAGDLVDHATVVRRFLAHHPHESKDLSKNQESNSKI